VAGMGGGEAHGPLSGRVLAKAAYPILTYGRGRAKRFSCQDVIRCPTARFGRWKRGNDLIITDPYPLDRLTPCYRRHMLNESDMRQNR